MEQVYIAVGSNLGKPLQQAQQAIAALDAIPNSRVVSISSIYRTKPLGITRISQIFSIWLYY